MRALLMDPLEQIFRSEHDRLWRSLVAFSGDDEVPTSGDAEVDASLVEFVDLLGDLSEQQRLVVVLQYAGGFRPKEIAAVLHTTPGTVRVQLHRAHTQLREQMGSR